MADKKLKVLILGAGSIGLKEAKVLRNHPLVDVVGVVEIDKERREAVSKYVDTTYSDAEKAIDKANPDLVRIATPPETHHPLAMMAMKKGKDVYLEKIMTVRSKESKDIVDYAKKNKRKVYVRRNAIYTAVYQEAWRKLKDIGEIRHIHWVEPRQEYSFWSKPKQKWLKRLPGGIISEHLPHALYTVRWFLGGEPEVDEVIYTEKELRVSMTCGDKKAYISYLAPSDVPMLLNIVGSKGVIMLDHSTYRTILPRGFEDSSSPEMRTAVANFSDIFGALGNFCRLIGHFFVRELRLNPKSIYSKSDNYRQFTDIAQGKVTGDFRIDGEEGLRNVELFEKIWKKAGEVK